MGYFKYKVVIYIRLKCNDLKVVSNAIIENYLNVIGFKNTLSTLVLFHAIKIFYGIYIYLHVIICSNSVDKSRIILQILVHII
jgi:hypothetical protein